MEEARKQSSSEEEDQCNAELGRQRSRYSGMDVNRLRNECLAHRSKIKSLEAEICGVEHDPNKHRSSRADRKRRLPKLKLELHRLRAQYETASQLLEDVEEMGDTEEALRRAAARGDEATVKRLLSRGVDVNCPDGTGHTAFMYAVGEGHLNVAKTMITEGEATINPDSKTPPLALAANRGHHDIVQLLIDTGANVDARDEANRTPLLIASEKDSTACARALLEAKSNPNATDPYGNTSLHNAAKNGNASLAQLLVDHGANAFLTNSQHMTALAIARTRRHFEVADAIAESTRRAHTVFALCSSGEAKVTRPQLSRLTDS